MGGQREELYGAGHQQSLLGEAEALKGERFREARKGRPGLRVGDIVSEATGRSVRWPDPELTSQAAVAVSCGEEEGEEVASPG